MPPNRTNTPDSQTQPPDNDRPPQQVDEVQVHESHKRVDELIAANRPRPSNNTQIGTSSLGWKKPIMAGLAALLVIGGGVTAWLALSDSNAVHNSSSGTIATDSAQNTKQYSSASAAIDAFVLAMQQQDKAKVYALQSKAFTQLLRKETGKNLSNYSVACSSSAFCSNFFKQSFLSKAKTNLTKYTAKDGTAGKTRVYKLVRKSRNKQVTGKTVTKLSISAVPVDGSWHIDYISRRIEGSFNTSK